VGTEIRNAGIWGEERTEKDCVLSVEAVYIVVHECEGLGQDGSTCPPPVLAGL
jgi:hypothetical protein